MSTVASDEEFRKVAEDMRALARSLARDLWDATQSGRATGRPPSEAFRSGLRNAAHGARREFHRGLRNHRYGWGPPWQQGWGPPGPYGRYRRPPHPGSPDGTGAPGSPPGPDASAGSAHTAAGGRYGPRPQAAYGPWGGRARPARRADRRGRPLPPVRRKWDATVLLALLVVVFGLAWLVGGTGIAHLSIEGVLAAGLMLLGAAMVVAGRTDWSLSRHAWPIVLGAGLVVALFATSATFGVSGALSHISFGNMHRTATGGSTVYGGFGQLTVDARGLRPEQTAHVQSVAGQTVVEIPANRDVLVHAQVLAGQICIDGHDVSNGLGASSGTYLAGPPGPQVPPANLYIHQSAGRIQVGQGC